MYLCDISWATLLFLSFSTIQPRLQTCICSVADDHSVAILSTSEKKCLLLAASHASPIVGIHWRPAEDFLLVNCADGRLYVWQVEACEW